jgi:hypothetical protein
MMYTVSIPKGLKVLAIILRISFARLIETVFEYILNRLRAEGKSRCAVFLEYARNALVAGGASCVIAFRHTSMPHTPASITHIHRSFCHVKQFRNAHLLIIYILTSSHQHNL